MKDADPEYRIGVVVVRGSLRMVGLTASKAEGPRCRNVACSYHRRFPRRNGHGRSNRYRAPLSRQVAEFVEARKPIPGGRLTRC